MNITFDTWKTAIKTLFTFDLWWRIAVISAIQVAIIYPIAVFIIEPYLARGIESGMDIVNNTSSATLMSTYGAAIAILLSALVIIEIGILCLAAFHITTKKFFQKEESNPLQVFAQDAVAAFVAFHLYLFRMMWYVLQPVVIVGIPLVIAGLALRNFADSIPFELIGTATGIVMLAVVVYRSFQVAFAIPLYFENEGKKERKEIFDQAVAFSKGKLLNIFLSGLGLGLVLGLIGLAIGAVIGGVMSLSGISSIDAITAAAGNVVEIVVGGLEIIFFYVLYKTMEKGNNADAGNEKGEGEAK